MLKTVGRLVMLASSLSVTCFAQLTSPQIVATVSLINQTAQIRSTPLFTPQADGLFRVSAYLLRTKAGSSNQDWCLTTAWIDDLGLEYDGRANEKYICIDAAGSRTTYQFADSVHVIRANAGTTVSYTLTGPDGGGSVYELYITVEQLQ
jgi:hypothetical protein